MVKQYFAACEQAFPAQRAELRRILPGAVPGRCGRHGDALRHAAAGPEGLLELRSIGKKSLGLIEAVCARYEASKTASQGDTPLRQTGSCLTRGQPPAAEEGGTT